MDVEIVKTCPYGSKCREIKNNKMYVCHMLVESRRVNVHTQEETKDELCAIPFLTILMADNVAATRGTQAATESFRNDMLSAAASSQEALLSYERGSLNGYIEN